MLLFGLQLHRRVIPMDEAGDNIQAWFSVLAGRAEGKGEFPRKG